MSNQSDTYFIVCHEPIQTFNIDAHFIGPNPETSFNPESVFPSVAPTAYIGPFSSVIGDVTIGENVFIAPNVSIRADEGFPFYIDSETNIQDGVILHGLENGRVIFDNKEYSIYIGKHVSCTHGCIVHGPCKIGNSVFVGFHSIVLNAIVGDGCYISHNALVTGGVILEPNRYVPAGSIIDTQEKADRLGPVPQDQHEFAQEVQHINHEFPNAYSLLFGSTKCSCGLACDSRTIKPVLQEHTLGNVRIIHTVPDAPDIDVYINNRIIAEDLAYSQFTVYTPMPEGTYTLSVYVSGTTDSPILTNTLRIDKNTSTTAAVVGTLNTIGLLAIPDDYRGTPSVSNEAKVRFIHLASNVPAVDVVLPSGVFLFDSVSYKELTEYKSFAPGSNLIQVRLARTPTAILLRIPFILQPRLVYTIYFIGTATKNPGLDALILLDGFFIEVEE